MEITSSEFEDNIWSLVLLSNISCISVDPSWHFVQVSLWRLPHFCYIPTNKTLFWTSVLMDVEQTLQRAYKHPICFACVSDYIKKWENKNMHPPKKTNNNRGTNRQLKSSSVTGRSMKAILHLQSAFSPSLTESWSHPLPESPPHPALELSSIRITRISVALNEVRTSCSLLK